MAVCKSSTLVYGPTGAGKTDMIGTWARRLLAAHPGKKIRVVTAEPNGLATIEWLLDPEFADVWDISGSNHFMQDLHFATQGYWPTSGGLVAPGATGNNLSEIIGYAYEGVTAFSYLCIEELKDLGAKNQITGAASAPARFKSGDLQLAGANETMYGTAQQRVLKAISVSHTLPVHVFWTALELKYQDKETREFAYGPQAAGKAATKHIPPKFGSTIHLARVQLKAGGKEEVKRVAFFDEHYLPDDPKTPYLAQIRVPSAYRKDLPIRLDITDKPDMLMEFFDLVEATMKKARQELLRKSTTNQGEK